MEKKSYILLILLVLLFLPACNDIDNLIVYPKEFVDYIGEVELASLEEDASIRNLKSKDDGSISFSLDEKSRLNKLKKLEEDIYMGIDLIDPSIIGKDYFKNLDFKDVDISLEGDYSQSKARYDSLVFLLGKDLYEYNLYNHEKGSRIRLVDLDGNILVEYSFPEIFEELNN